MIIQVAEWLDDRESAVVIVSGDFLAFMVLPFALIFALTWWLLKRSLRSIDSLASQLSERNPLDLTAILFA